MVSVADTFRTDDHRPVDHTGLRVLSFAECLERIASQPIGRVAFAHNGEIAVLPVHHVIDGAVICFRTSGPSKLEAAADHDSVGFEVDHFDPQTRGGWSVTATGAASIVEDADTLARLAASDPMPWHLGDPKLTRWIQIRCTEISGRELVAPVDAPP